MMEFMNGLALLDSDQVDHYLRCKQRFTEYGFYVDQSVMGSGKTYVALALAQTMSLRLFVVGPKSALAMWEEKASEYNVIIEKAVSYQTLTGTGKGQPAHGLLTRTVVKDNNGVEETIYKSTDTWSTLLRTYPVLVVVDEAHNCKNPGNKEKAVRALLDGVRKVRQDNHSIGYALLSASLMDKDHLCIQFLRILGIYTMHALVDPLQGRRPGYEEIVRNMRAYAPRTVGEISFPPAVVASTSSLWENVYKLFVEALLPACASSMPDPILPSTMSNVFYHIGSPVLKKRLEQSYADLQQALRYDHAHATVHITDQSFAAVNVACRDHEWALAEVALRDAWAWMRSHPSGKVIVFTNYHRTLQFVRFHLEASGIKCVHYDGTMTTKQRTASVHSFQNDTQTRAFVSNIAAGGVSISLHDLVGNQPRLVLIFPTYKILDVYQATGRAVRRGMRTTTDVRMMYSADHPLLHMFNALARKTEVLKCVNKSSDVYGTHCRLYPGEFPLHKPTLNDGVDAGGDYSKHWHTKQDLENYQDRFEFSTGDDDLRVICDPCDE